MLGINTYTRIKEGGRYGNWVFEDFVLVVAASIVAYCLLRLFCWVISHDATTWLMLLSKRRKIIEEPDSWVVVRVKRGMRKVPVVSASRKNFENEPWFEGVEYSVRV